MRHTISRNPFCGLGFRSLEHYQNSTPFSSPILGAGFRRYPRVLSEKSYSLSRLMCRQETAEPWATAARKASRLAASSIASNFCER